MQYVGKEHGLISRNSGNKQNATVKSKVIESIILERNYHRSCEKYITEASVNVYFKFL